MLHNIRYLCDAIRAFPNRAVRDRLTGGLIFLSRTAHRNDVLTSLLPHLLPPTAGLDLAPRLIDRVISVREFYSAAASAPRQGYNVNFSRHVDFLSFFFSPLFAAHTV